MFFGFGDAVLVVGTGMVEIEFIQNDEAGFFLFKDKLSDFAILGGNTFREVDDEHAEIGAADGFFGTDGGEDLDGVIAFATRPEAGGVDKGKIFASVGIRKIDRIASGAGDFGNDGPFVLEDGVDKRGFSGVGFADHCEFDPDLFGDFHAFFGLDVKGFDDGIDFIDEFGEVATVFCGNEHAIREAKRGEIGEGGFVFVVIDLVEDEKDWWFGFAEFLRERLVDGGEAFLGIDNEKDEIGRLHCDVGLHSDLFAKAIVKRCADAACIDERAGMGGEVTGRGNAIAGDAGLIVDDGDFPTRKAVKERGFPDIGATDDGDSRHKFQFSNFNSQGELCEKLEVLRRSSDKEKPRREAF